MPPASYPTDPLPNHPIPLSAPPPVRSQSPSPQIIDSSAANLVNKMHGVDPIKVPLFGGKLPHHFPLNDHGASARNGFGSAGNGSGIYNITVRLWMEGVLPSSPGLALWVMPQGFRWLPPGSHSQISFHRMVSSSQ